MEISVIDLLFGESAFLLSEFSDPNGHFIPLIASNLGEVQVYTLESLMAQQIHVVQIMKISDGVNEDSVVNGSLRLRCDAGRFLLLYVAWVYQTVVVFTEEPRL